MKNLNVPNGRIDAVLDTDTYNEVDDQFALVYMLKLSDKINLKIPISTENVRIL